MPIRSLSPDEWGALWLKNRRVLLCGLMGGFIAGFGLMSLLSGAMLMSNNERLASAQSKTAELQQRVKDQADALSICKRDYDSFHAQCISEEAAAKAKEASLRQKIGIMASRLSKPLQKPKPFTPTDNEKRVFEYAFKHFKTGYGRDEDIVAHDLNLDPAVLAYCIDRLRDEALVYRFFDGQHSNITVTAEGRDYFIEHGSLDGWPPPDMVLGWPMPPLAESPNKPQLLKLVPSHQMPTQ